METTTASVQRIDSVVANSPAESQVRVCLISLGGELFAIDLHSVSEVFEVDAVTPVPGMPGALVGVANLRGLVIPLVDLRASLGLATGGAALPYAVVVRHGEQLLAVLIERVPEIRTIQREQFLPAVQNARETPGRLSPPCFASKSEWEGCWRFPRSSRSSKAQAFRRCPCGRTPERCSSDATSVGSY